MSTTLDRAVPGDARPRSQPAPAAAPVRHVPPDLEAARDLHTRLNAALAGLGLSGALSTRWVTPARSGFFYAPHNLHQATRLVLELEHLGESVAGDGVGSAGRRCAAPGPGQLSLPFDGPV
jgi:hypothetical protein